MAGTDEVPGLDRRMAVLSPYLYDGVPLAETARRGHASSRTARRWLASYRAGLLGSAPSSTPGGARHRPAPVRRNRRQHLLAQQRHLPALNPTRHPEFEDHDPLMRAELVIIDEADRIKTTGLEELPCRIDHRRRPRSQTDTRHRRNIAPTNVVKPCQLTWPFTPLDDAATDDQEPREQEMR